MFNMVDKPAVWMQEVKLLPWASASNCYGQAYGSQVPPVWMSYYQETYMTGNTLGNTTEASAKYWYRIRVSLSSVEYFTSVANTVSTNACVEKSVSTSGSRRTLFSFDTDTRALRSCTQRNGPRIHYSSIMQESDVFCTSNGNITQHKIC